MTNYVLPDAVFFDWDGTLADTYNFLNDAHNYVLVELGFKPFKEGEYAEYFGKPRDILYPAIYHDKHELAKRHFEVYVLNNAHRIKPLDGAEDILRFFQGNGVRMGVVSNKKAIFIENEIKHFGWNHYFEVIVGGGDAAQDKPAPDPLFLALERASIPKDSPFVWFVGDTENDLKCATDAGCPVLFVRGHEDPKPLIDLYKPEIYADSCRELHKILVEIPKNSSTK